MAFIYITGAPGVGKSTLQKCFQDVGLEAYDLDAPQFGGPYNKASGERVTIPPAAERAKDWFDRHEWRICRSAFEDLKIDSREKSIVIFGVAESDTEIIDLFDKVMYLYISDNELKERLHSRVDNDYGKNESELNEILERKKKLDARYSDSLAIRIDASRSLKLVVDDILAHTKD